MAKNIDIHIDQDNLILYEVASGITGVGNIIHVTKDTITIGYSTKALNIKLSNTSSSTSASASVEPYRFDTIMTGAGGVGGRMRVHLETNVALGGWANALKVDVDCKTNGRATGLLSVANAEITMPASAGGAGTYAVYEAEVVCPTSWTGTNGVAVFYIGTSGATKANFDTYGYLFDIRGVTSATDGFWHDHAGAHPANIEEWLRIKTPAGDRYIPVYDAQT